MAERRMRAFNIVKLVTGSENPTNAPGIFTDGAYDVNPNPITESGLGGKSSRVGGLVQYPRSLSVAVTIDTKSLMQGVVPAGFPPNVADYPLYRCQFGDNVEKFLEDSFINSLRFHVEEQQAATADFEFMPDTSEQEYYAYNLGKPQKSAGAPTQAAPTSDMFAYHNFVLTIDGVETPFLIFDLAVNVNLDPRGEGRARASGEKRLVSWFDLGDHTERVELVTRAPITGWAEDDLDDDTLPAPKDLVLTGTKGTDVITLTLNDIDCISAPDRRDWKRISRFRYVLEAKPDTACLSVT